MMSLVLLSKHRIQGFVLGISPVLEQVKIQNQTKSKVTRARILGATIDHTELQTVIMEIIQIQIVQTNHMLVK